MLFEVKTSQILKNKGSITQINENSENARNKDNFDIHIQTYKPKYTEYSFTNVKDFFIVIEKLKNIENKNKKILIDSLSTLKIEREYIIGCRVLCILGFDVFLVNKFDEKFWFSDFFLKN